MSGMWMISLYTETNRMAPEKFSTGNMKVYYLPPQKRVTVE
jgi:hypothetical protein